MNVDEMDGRGIDVLVAERVMGWRIIHHNNGAVYAVIPGSIEWHAIHWADGRDNDWSPSTDIATSFQVDRPTWRWEFYEEMDHLEVTLYVPVNGGLNVVGSPIAESVRTIIIDVPWSESGSKAQTYALGRCRAALKAIR